MRGLRRGRKTDLDKDRDRTGNDGSHKEKKVESYREPERERSSGGRCWELKGEWGVTGRQFNAANTY